LLFQRPPGSRSFDVGALWRLFQAGALLCLPNMQGLECTAGHRVGWVGAKTLGGFVLGLFWALSIRWVSSFFVCS